MYSLRYYLFIFILSNAFCLIFSFKSFCQQKITPTQNTQDTFFLAKKKGLLGRLGRSIGTNAPINQGSLPATKNVTSFASYKGRVINHIKVMDVSFGVSVNDTSQVFRNFLTKAANNIHKPTRERLIRTNLFFHEGEQLNPNLIADNVRYLRNISYLQDARIEVVPAIEDSNEVDVNVFYKDVFSLGGVAQGTSNSLFAELRDNNIMGTGQELVIQNLYDLNRNPHYGWGIQYLKRNIGNTFANLSLGYQNVANAYSDGRRDETYVSARVNLPLVSPYYLWTGSAEISSHYNTNRYTSDSIFQSDNQYYYNDFDAWVGYNISGKNLKKDSIDRKVKHFLAVRVTDRAFQNIPDKYKITYNSQYLNIQSLLGAYTFFKQEYYHANYIYGFGRNEDVPEGYNISLIGGLTNENNVKRPYAGINLEDNYFSKRGNYFDYVLKVGGYYRNKGFDDLSVLLNLDAFTKLAKLSARWYYRSFFTVSAAHQFNRYLDAPLILNSTYGIPQFAGDSSNLSTSRGSINWESVFYNTWKLAGFSFAPLAFANLSVLKTDYINGNNSYGSDINGYFGSGLGLRTRNENLVFGTIELRFFYFPRTVGTMTPLTITITTNLSYKFNSQYITRPDFVTFN